jgi:hypothetical protein
MDSLRKIIRKNLMEILERQTGDLEYVNTPNAKPENDKYDLGEDEEAKKFLTQEIERVKNLSTIEELDKYILEHTLGHMIGFNPIDPFRTVCREKFKELGKKAVTEREKDIVHMALIHLEGERKDIHIPDGAMI